ncbi:MAG: aspartate/tyrosine/aromatic aminotransferase [Verrucomicrobiota bacterium]|nr:aspartate/tyrosine/aromatic aminotransferase [Verrucomicrobiota bacterium]
MFFDTILEAPPDPIFGLNHAFAVDGRQKKVNLAVGIYKDEQLRTPLMSAVRKAGEQLAEQDVGVDYLPIDGFPPFCQSLGSLVFGDANWKQHHGRIAAVQAVGGTSALRIAGQFLVQEVTETLSLPHPTWANHQQIFVQSGLCVKQYSYCQNAREGVDFSGLLAFVRQIEKRSAFVLHAVCHNPTGLDLSMEQWKELGSLMTEKEILPFFDFAYHGFGEGLEKDRAVLEYFLETGCEMIVAYSCSKNFSLYNQRVGGLFIAAKDPAVKTRLQSQLSRIIRALYSNPPAYGARLVHHILTHPPLFLEWREELERMHGRLKRLRESFVSALTSEGADWNFLLRQKGMFAFLDLEKQEVSRLIEEFAIYLPDRGRIALAALSEQNIDYVTDAILSL